MRQRSRFAGLLSLLLAGCAAAPPATAPPPAAPLAEQRPHVVRAPHGAERVDEYYWLRDDARSDPAMLDYLAAENRYADALLAPLAATREQVYAEIVARATSEQDSTPFRYHGYWYWERYPDGAEYPQHWRRADRAGALDELIFDEAELARGKDFFDVGDWEISPDGRWLLWSEDHAGRLQYQLKLRPLAGGAVQSLAAGVAPDLLWTADSHGFYYIENDPVTLLGQRVKHHVLDAPVEADVLAYAESDSSYYLSLFRTRSERYLCVFLSSTLATEQRCLDQQADGEDFLPLQARERGIEYDADHLGSRWVIRSNWQASNFRLLEAAEQDIGERTRWRELLAHDADVLLEDFVLFDDFIAVQDVADALPRLRVLQAGQPVRTVAADEAAYTMSLGDNADPSLPTLRFDYSSLATPPSVYDYDLRSGSRRLIQRQRMPEDYRPGDYLIERIAVPARDGASIPVTVVRRRDTPVDGSAALFQYAYGSYGSSTEPRFNPAWASLLDRGVVYAIAHVRGGSERGRGWYEHGKLMEKMNTFTDFIDVTDALVARGYAAPGRVAAMGRSAGGLLMGAITNMAPDKYRVIVTQVPFVDVLTTMLDPTIPLTTNEYDEWGNPERAADYAYMARYSPYDNLSAQRYPALYVSTGLWDSQVQYYEPAKYVARLRRLNQAAEPVLFRVDMSSGHGGGSGRAAHYAQSAEFIAFVLEQLQVEPGLR